MTLQDQIQISVNITFVGVVVVFLVLTLLIIIISIFARIMRRPAKPDDAVSNTVEPADADYSTRDKDAEFEEGISQLSGNGEPGPELIAVIMAAVAAMDQGMGFRISSIRRVGRKSTAWNISGRNEYLSTRL